MDNIINVNNAGITTETVILNNNIINKRDIGWNANYNGNEANISMDVQNNGRHKHYDIYLNNDDLADMLNIQSIKQPLHKRLKHDFKSKTPSLSKIYLDNSLSNSNNIESIDSDNILSNIIKQPTHISSPLSNEEFIIPVTIGNNSIKRYTLTPRRRHKKVKTHKTHKVYKKRNTNTSKYTTNKTKRSSRKIRSI